MSPPENKKPTPQAAISPTEALYLLLPACRTAHAAAVWLTDATYANDCRLWCNGNLLPPDYITTSLKVVARAEPDGRWRADVVSSIREAWEPGVYRFEYDDGEVRALLPRRKPRQKPGRKPTGNWPELIRHKLKAMTLNRALELQKSGELRRN